MYSVITSTNLRDSVECCEGTKRERERKKQRDRERQSIWGRQKERERERGEVQRNWGIEKGGSMRDVCIKPYGSG